MYDRKLNRLTNIAFKVYYCEKCDRSFRDNTELNNHLKGMKHNPDKYVSYSIVSL